MKYGNKKPGAKDELVDHFWPVRLHLAYIAKPQILNSGFCWSILSDQLWSIPLVFPSLTGFWNSILDQILLA